MTAAARLPASPYARRLARERGFALDLIAGTGPGGRIVAADVEAFARRRAAEPAPRAASILASVAAYACAVDLTRLQQLLGDFGGADLAVDLDDMLVRAAGLALEALAGASPAPARAVAWESGGATTRRLTVITDAHLGLVSALHVRLAAGLAAPADGAPPQAAVSIRRIAEHAIRPTAMPLLPGIAMRLLVTPSAGSGASEALLCFDADTVGEDEAASFLARFRDSLETPLRLLA